MTLRDFLVGVAAGLTVIIIAGHFKGETGALIALGLTVLLLCVTELYFYSRGLVIHYAGHGMGDDEYADVTNIVKSQVKNDRINFVIDGSVFPDDPYQNKKKFLIVRYSFQSRRIREKIKQDGDRMTLP